MMAAILNSTMLESDTINLDLDTLLSSLRFTQKHSHSILALTQTNSIWFKLIHSHWTWWWQSSCILKSWIWPSWIQLSNIFLSNSLTLAKIGSHHLHKKLHSFYLTEIVDGGHLEFCHVGISNLSISFQSHLHLPRLVPTICTKNNFTHSFWLNLMVAAILKESDMPSWIQTPCYLLSDSLKNTLTPLWLWLKLIQSDSNSFHSQLTWWW